MIERYQPLLRALARRYSSVHNSTDDLTQEASLGVIIAYHTYDPSRNSLTSWITSVARNRILVWLRDHGTSMKIALRHKQDGTYPVVFSIEYTQYDAGEVDSYRDFDVWQHLGCLTLRQAETIKCHLEGFSQREIAEITGVTQMTVSRDLQTAITTLRRCAGVE